MRNALQRVRWEQAIAWGIVLLLALAAVAVGSDVSSDVAILLDALPTSAGLL